jgi:uncharacterized protein YqiB (DUF1249 family)
VKNKLELPHFEAYTHCCTANYLLLQRLLPKKRLASEIFTWPMNKLELQIEVEEQSRFTENLAIRQKVSYDSDWLADFVIQLKLCLDVRVAEITHYRDGHERELGFQAQIQQELWQQKVHTTFLLYEALLCCIRQQRQRRVKS